MPKIAADFLDIAKLNLRDTGLTTLDDRNQPRAVTLAKHMKTALRFISTLAFSAYVYGELAAHVYPFVLLPQVGVHLRVIALTLFAFIHAGASFGWKVGSLMFLTTAFVTWSFEQVGVATGAIYGHYHYSDMLGPKLGAIPILIPLAWFMMIYPSYLVTNLVFDGRMFPESTDVRQILIRALLAAMVMTAWDAVIDPAMSHAGFWVWEHGGSYFGVPRHNFAGWLATTFVVYLVFGFLHRWLKPFVNQRRDCFGLLPILAYAAVALVQVANQNVTPTSIVALFAMGFPVLLALARWSQISAKSIPKEVERVPTSLRRYLSHWGQAISLLRQSSIHEGRKRFFSRSPRAAKTTLC
ncbi:MAG: carotenoid biosynthesis protein [Verrucomicrobia bacterium]|nr:carotenoid biosynthesis protein [Verrucomicrobiota bacterium]